MNISRNNAPRLLFGSKNNVQEFTLILADKSLKHLGQIKNIPTDTIVYNANFNSADELSFTLYKELDGIKDPLWDSVKQFSIVWVKELNEYFEITYEQTQTENLQKKITCTSLCEAELGQINLYNIEINTQSFWDDYADLHKGEDYELPVYVFYCENPTDSKRSLLTKILDKAPHYSIGHVDDSLKDLQRTFSIDGTSIYDFMSGDLAKEFNCTFQFNTVTRTIDVYDLYSVCDDINCNYYINENHQYYSSPDHKFYREDGITECPYCGNKHLYYFGNDTTVFVEQGSLTDEIGFSTDTDAVKNCFKLEAGDDYMTATIKNINYGSDYIMHFSDEMKSMMSSDLVDAIESYDEERERNWDTYNELNVNIYNCLDQIGYLTSSMMPEASTDTTNAAAELAKLTSTALSPISIETLTSSTTYAIAENAIKNYALVFVTPGRFKVEIASRSSWTPGNNTGTWVGKLKVTNYSDEDDVAIHEQPIEITFNTNYQSFIEQKKQKQIYNNASKSDSSSIWGILYTYNANTGKYTPVTEADFEQACTQYSLNRLESFSNAIETGLEVLKTSGNGSDSTNTSSDQHLIYTTMYQPLVRKLTICNSAIDTRQTQIDDINWNMGVHTVDADGEETGIWNNPNSYCAQREALQDLLNFRTWLDNHGVGLYDEFCSFRREDKYSNSNFISDLYYENDDTEGIIDQAKEYLELATQELIKSSTAQHTISTNLYNLLTIEEFQPLIQYFQLGNFIRVKTDDKIYKMRLLHYEINFGDLTTINTEFSDMTYVGSIVSDLQSVIESTKQMASSYSSVSKQSEKGQEANNTFEDIKKEGLNTVLYEIKSNNTQDITIDEHGILGRAYDDITDAYDDVQIRINSNVIAFTKDNWDSVETALGYQYYYYPLGNNPGWKKDFGLNTNFVIGGYIQGSDIVGSNFWGVDANNQKNGFKIDEAGNIENNGNQILANGNLNLGKDSSNNYHITWNGSTLAINGTLTANAGSKIGPWNVTVDSIYNGKLSIDANTDGVYIGTGGISLGAGNKFKVTRDGVLTATGATITGTIISTAGGSIGDWHISEQALWNGKPSYSSTTAGVYLGTNGISLGDANTYFKVNSAGQAEGFRFRTVDYIEIRNSTLIDGANDSTYFRAVPYIANRLALYANTNFSYDELASLCAKNLYLNNYINFYGYATGSLINISTDITSANSYVIYSSGDDDVIRFGAQADAIIFRNTHIRGRKVWMSSHDGGSITIENQNIILNPSSNGNLYKDSVSLDNRIVTVKMLKDKGIWTT